MSSKVSRGFALLKYAKKSLPFSALTSLFTSSVGSHFRYCYSVWGSAGTTETNGLQNELIDTLRWNTINELIDIESKTMVFKSLNELTPPYLRSLFGKIHKVLRIGTYYINRSKVTKQHRKRQEILFI